LQVEVEEVEEQLHNQEELVEQVVEVVELQVVHL
jgi:hypothetical protein